MAADQPIQQPARGVPAVTRLPRRRFLQTMALASSGFASSFAHTSAWGDAQVTVGAGDVAVLPTGPSHLPVDFPHFPTRLHAFVWRNWQLVPAERLAAVVATTPAQIVALGRRMGLRRSPRITVAQQRRSYISVIKRNWHLLPYEQLLVLLDRTADELAFTLREDDFLFHKLGNQKPRCEPLRFARSSASTRRREAEMA